MSYGSEPNYLFDHNPPVTNFRARHEIAPFTRMLIFGLNYGYGQELIRMSVTEQKTIYLDVDSIRQAGDSIIYETVHKFNRPFETINEQNVRVLFDLAINEFHGNCASQMTGLKSILFFPTEKGAAPFRFHIDLAITNVKAGSYGSIELSQACSIVK